MSQELANASIGLVGVIIGGAISALTTIAVARSERKKFRIERSWELRREAYNRIYGALDRARAITRYISDEYDSDPHGWDQSEFNKRASKQMVEYLQDARTTFHANRLMLSQGFVDLYDQLISAIKEADNPNLIPPEMAEAAAQAMDTIVPQIEALAKNELGIA